MATTKARKSSAGTVNAPATAPTPDAVKVALATAEPITLPLDMVEAMPGWNMRTDFPDSELAKLATSIREVGQLAPVIVMKHPKREAYLLVAGEKRCRAIERIAEEDKVSAPTVRAVIIDPATAKQAMIEENFKREGISHADRCRFVAAQLNEGMKVEQLAKLLGVSDVVIYTDRGIANGLAPEIFEAWSKFPKASKIALRIYAKSHDEQRALWEEWLSGQTDEGKAAKKKARQEGGAPEGEGGETEGKKPSKSNLSTMYRELTGLADYLGDTGGPSRAWLDGATWALEYMATGGSLPAHIADLLDKKNNPPKQRELFPAKQPAKTEAVKVKVAGE